MLKKLKLKLDRAINTIEKSLGSIVKIFIGAAIVYALIFGYLIYKTSKEQSITDATVMITRLTGGGGSGVIIENTAQGSSILTNNHVCEVIANGGIVTTTKGKQTLVVSYSPDSLHDLCLVTVAEDLGVSAKVAKHAPKPYSEATISGHPALLPNVVAKGHFSGKKIIQVLIGFKKCTPQMLEETPELNGICGFFGGLPIVKTYESILVTAMIMAGSSGSAVYDNNGDIAGLVFAGSGDLSYAYTVPFEYVALFLNGKGYREEIVVDYTLKFDKGQEEEQGKQRSQYYEFIEKKCKNVNDPKFKEYCDLIIRDNTFRTKGLR
jgi:hypothetical protein